MHNLVVVDLIKYRWNRGKDHQLFFFRDNHGLEVDLLFQQGHHLQPIEIKLSSTYSSEFGKKLRKFKELIGDRALSAEIIFTGDRAEDVNAMRLTPWPQMSL